jgi:hypothetical protein
VARAAHSGGAGLVFLSLPLAHAKCFRINKARACACGTTEQSRWAGMDTQTTSLTRNGTEPGTNRGPGRKTGRTTPPTTGTERRWLGACPRPGRQAHDVGATGEPVVEALACRAVGDGDADRDADYEGHNREQGINSFVA